MAKKAKRTRKAVKGVERRNLTVRELEELTDKIIGQQDDRNKASPSCC
jgi:hypothetical protein